MALTQQVSDSLDDAKANLRNALSFAARTEEPYVSKHIADVLMAIETIKDTHNYLANLKDVMGEDKYS